MTAKKRSRPQPPRRPPQAPAPAVPSAALPSAPAASPKVPDDKVKLGQLLADLEAARGSRAIVYWTTPAARISQASVVPFYDQLSAIGKRERIDLFLFTDGGDTEVPWRLVSLIREFAASFAVLIPHRAMSAGTVLALGADEIVMTPLGVLGPIDPSRTHPLLPRREGAPEAEPISVQDMRHAMQFIREAAGPDATYTPDAMAEIFKALFDKIHPLAIGAIEQSYALSKLIATRCLETHMDASADAAKIKGIVDRLCDEFKSHAYQIGRHEARALGLNVVDAPPDVEKAMMELYKLYVGRPVAPMNPGVSPKAGTFVRLHIAWLDSTDLNLRVETQQVVQADQTLKAVSDEWVPY